MSDISDNELILFHYRDGLTPQRVAEIETALAASPALIRRYRTLGRLLSELDADVPPMPDPQFELRLWQRLRPRLMDIDERTGASPLAVASLRPVAARTRSVSRRRYWRVGLATAAGLATLAVWLGSHELRPPLQDVPTRSFVAETRTTTPALATSQTGDVAWRVSADRILVEEVVDHLRSTQGVLQSVVYSDSATLMPVDDAYVRALVRDNHLYAAAADHRDRKALAGFLRTLDPILIELANRSGGATVQQDTSMRDFVRDSELLFQVRAVQARLQAQA